jgi:prepilin-type N-terminal cleavage/methylation domain-containing protein
MKRGFTLIELLVVLVIIACLVGIVITYLQNMR